MIPQYGLPNKSLISQYSQKTSTQKWQQLLDTREELKMVSYLSYILWKCNALSIKWGEYILRWKHIVGKNWAEYTKDPYILDAVSNGLQLNLKKIPVQQGSGSYCLSSRDRYHFAGILKIIVKKLTPIVIVGSIAETDELLSGVFTRRK